MKTDNEKLIENIKEQIQLFLISAGEFYPFGCCIDKSGSIKPLGAYLPDRSPSPLELISMIEKHINQGLVRGEYKVGAIAVDVTIKQDGIAYDAVEIRFFEPYKERYKKYLRYSIKGSHVEFR